MSSTEHRDDPPTSILARLCSERTARQDPPPDGVDPCYELFRRAFLSPSDEEAWCAIMERYRRLVHFWLSQYADDDTIQETFLRFWQAQCNAFASFSSRFPDLRAVMSYLKRCAVAVRIEAWREEERSARLHERLCEKRRLETTHRPPVGEKAIDLRTLLSSKFNSEEERVVFELTYYFDLPPRDIQAERPDLFPDVNLVYRVKENLLKRLRRDPELGAYWSDLEGG